MVETIRIIPGGETIILIVSAKKYYLELKRHGHGAATATTTATGHGHGPRPRATATDPEIPPDPKTNILIVSTFFFFNCFETLVVTFGPVPTGDGFFVDRGRARH